MLLVSVSKSKRFKNWSGPFKIRKYFNLFFIRTQICFQDSYSQSSEGFWQFIRREEFKSESWNSSNSQSQSKTLQRHRKAFIIRLKNFWWYWRGHCFFENFSSRASSNRIVRFVLCYGLISPWNAVTVSRCCKSPASKTMNTGYFNSRPIRGRWIKMKVDGTK